MKSRHYCISTAALLIQFGAVAQSSIIYQNDFSGTLNPGWSRTTLGDNAFHQVWSVAPSLESGPTSQHARFDIAIPSLPGNSNATWYGGFLAFAGSMMALPVQWQLSFDVSLNTVEPLRVSFEFNPPGGPFPPPPSTTMTYWVQPSDVGWQRLVIDQNTPYTLGQFPSGAGPGTFLRISLASHDPARNALSISHIGTYDFLLDNVLLQAVPEPQVPVFLGMGAVLLIAMRRCRTHLG